MVGTGLMTRCVNDLEIRVFGMRRSGNHGIINWMGAQSPYKPHFFNCASNRGHSPFRTGKSTKDIMGIWYPHDNYKHASEDKIKMIAEMHKEILIYNYEDFDLTKLASEEFPTDREKVIGKSKKRIDILILRDFINWLASKLLVPEDQRRGEKSKYKFQDFTMARFDKNRKEFGGFIFYLGWEKDASVIRGLNYSSIPKMIERWEHCAKETLGETHMLENPIFISYDLWHTDVGYRRKLIEKIGFQFTDEGKDVVSRVGKGSSFQLGEEKAHRLDVLNRWKYFEHNKIFKDLIRYHTDIMEYNNIIFGENKEIFQWLNNEI